MKLIVLSGKMRAGKSYIANYLANHYAYARVSLAEPLKQEVRDLGFSDEDVFNKPPWMRQLLIALGQARRAQEPTYWIDRAMAYMVHLMDQGVVSFVCDDCRFENELEAFKLLKEQGHEIVFARVERRGGPEPLDDSSETALDHYEGFDAYISADSGDTDALIEAALIALKFRKPPVIQLDLFLDPDHQIDNLDLS